MAMTTMVMTTSARSRCGCGAVKAKDATRCRACDRKASDARYAEAEAVVTTGTCPACGQALRRNLALTGWWQCSGFGAEGFRAPGASPCSFQTFTRR